MLHAGEFEFFDDIPENWEDVRAHIYLHIPPKFKSGLTTGYVCRHFGVTEGPKLKNFAFSWLYTGNMKIVFDSKMAKALLKGIRIIIY